MTIYRDPRTRNWAVKFRDASGKQRTVTANKENLEKYGIPVPRKIDLAVVERLRYAVAKNLKKEIAGSKEALRLSNLVVQFLQTRIISVHQKKHYELVLRKYLQEFLEDPFVTKIQLQDLERFVVFLANGRSIVSVRGYLIDVKVFFKWLARSGYIRQNPADYVKLPPRPMQPVRCLTPDQVKQLLQAIRGHHLEPAMIGYLNLGVRRSEITHIEWGDVNFEKNMIVIRGTKTSNAVREIPISESFKQFLEKLPRRSRYVFTNRHGEKLSVWALNSALKRLQKAKVVDFHFSFQTLRKTYGSLLVRSGKVPIEYVSKFMGHSDVKITMEWYLGLRGSDYREKVSSALDGMV